MIEQNGLLMRMEWIVYSKSMGWWWRWKSVWPSSFLVCHEPFIREIAFAGSGIYFRSQTPHSIESKRLKNKANNQLPPLFSYKSLLGGFNQRMGKKFYLWTNRLFFLPTLPLVQVTRRTYSHPICSVNWHLAVDLLR